MKWSSSEGGEPQVKDGMPLSLKRINHIQNKETRLTLPGLNTTVPIVTPLPLDVLSVVTGDDSIVTHQALGVGQIDTGEETIVDGIDGWLPPTTTSTLSVVSASANDTIAGSGARTIFIAGLDGSYNTSTETINLAGLTPVVTTKVFSRVNVMLVATAGNATLIAGVNDGIITASLGGTPLSVIPVNVGVSRQAVYTVASNQLGILDNWNGSSDGNKEYRVRLKIREDISSTTSPYVEYNFEEVVGSPFFTLLSIALPSRSEVILTGQNTSGGGGDATIIAGFHLTTIKLS